MPGQGRLGDKAIVPSDAHGCPGCPHPGAGPAISGSTNVFVNGRPALRVDDVGIHAACCGANTWQALKGAPAVFINGKPAFRVNDPSNHCGGSGKLLEGSANVIVGDGGSGGGGGGHGGGGSGSATSDGRGSQSARSSASNSAAQSEQAGVTSTQPAGAPVPESTDSAAQAAALKSAARTGVPFCEKCEAAAQRPQNSERGNA